MAKLADDIRQILVRAKPDARPESPDPEPERRYVFGGDRQTRIAGYAVRQNRRGVRRKRSTFNIIAAIFIAGVFIVLYISNILAVNRLAQGVNEQQLRLDKLIGANQVLRAEIDRKARWERVGRIAAEELNLRHPSVQPTWFDADEYNGIDHAE